MAIRPNGSAAEIPALNRRIQFLAEALPLRAELERAALRYTHNFHDAEDLVSETYIKAWAGFATFQEGTNFRAWIHRIMVNTRINGYRRARIPPQGGSDRRVHGRALRGGHTTVRPRAVG